jgi:hypothetical protein
MHGIQNINPLTGRGEISFRGFVADAKNCWHSNEMTAIPASSRENLNSRREAVEANEILNCYRDVLSVRNGRRLAGTRRLRI